MPTYFELLGRGDVSLFLGDFFFYARAGGALVFLALLLEFVGVILLLVGGALGARTLLIGSGVSACFAAILGAGASYLGYTQAARIVATASSPPRDADLDGAGSQLLFALGVPLTITTVLFVLIGVTWAVRRKAFERGS